MASTASSALLHLTSLTRTNPTRSPKLKPPSALSTRRQSLFLLTATTALTTVELKAKAEDIPLFGIRKKLQKVEEEAEVIVKEGIETAEKKLATVEKELATAEKGIETVEEEIETAVRFSNLLQAGVVVGAEVLGVLVATSVVNAILGPEAQRS